MLEKSVQHKQVFGAILNIESGNQGSIFSGAAGNLEIEAAYFIASTTKLYTTALILNMMAAGTIALDDTLGDFFEKDLIAGLNVFRGHDFSAKITIRHLLSHTSGISDYFLGKPRGGKSFANELVSGVDQSWSFEQALERAKSLRSAFPPGYKQKALYSDTNFQLLGKIIELRRGQPISQVFQDEIFKPLGLRNTYLFSNHPDQQPAPFYYGKRPLHIPLAMASFGPDGGIVSTAAECMLFLKAFFTGRFFPVDFLSQMTAEYRRIFFPLQYGLGIMRFQLPPILSLFQQVPEMLGHSGLCGAFAFYCPKKDLYINGTVNQVANPGLSYQLMVKAVNMV